MTQTAVERAPGEDLVIAGGAVSLAGRLAPAPYDDSFVSIVDLR